MEPNKMSIAPVGTPEGDLKKILASPVPVISMFFRLGPIPPRLFSWGGLFTVIPDQAALSGLIRSISCLFSLWAFQRSTARCAFNQNSGVFPNNLDNRKDMAGDTARRPNNSSLTVWRETYSFFASPVVVRLKSGIKSSRSISPGWVGAISRGLIFLMLIVHSLVIICYFNIIRITIDKFETHPPLIIDRYRVLSLSISLEHMKAVTRRHF
jgi:hypothetical protein